MTPQDVKARSLLIRAIEAQRDKELKQTLCQLAAIAVLIGASCSWNGNKTEAVILPNQLSTEIRLLELKEPKDVRKNRTSQLSIKKEPLQIWKSPYSRIDSKSKDKPKQKKETSTFDKAIAISLNNEGGYTPSDSNGYPAKYGVNQKYYRPLPGFPKHVRNLTKQQAITYYKTFYYQKDWDQKKYSIAYKAFLLDSSIQHGVGFANKLETSTSGDIKKAVNYRLCHVQRWAKRAGKRHLLAGISKRIRNYERGVV